MPIRIGVLLLLIAPLCGTAQVRPGQCGFDRWSVKTLTDRDRERVDFRPVDTTVAKLVAIRIHEIPYPDDGRIEPEELHVYRVRARLIEVRSEKDKDLHLLLADAADPDARMIAEIPEPACALGSGREEAFRQVHAAVFQMRLGDLIEIVGVGFFDYLHDSRGAAKNGFELHPVLSVRLVSQ
jgi:hypothetical protein